MRDFYLSVCPIVSNLSHILYGGSGDGVGVGVVLGSCSVKITSFSPGL